MSTIPDPPIRVARRAITGGALLYDAASGVDPAVLADAAGGGAQDAAAERVPGGRGAISYLRLGPRQVALRRYRRGGLPALLSRERYLWLGEERTRPFREFRLLAELAARGLPVPRPVAARYLRHGLSYRGELMTERLPDAVPLAQRWLAGAMADGDWRTAGRCIRRFHDAGVHHADLNANNVMLDGRGRAWLLDFDRGRIRGPGRWRERSLARLARSLAKIAGGAGRGDSWRAGFAMLRAAYDAGAAE